LLWDRPRICSWENHRSEQLRRPGSSPLIPMTINGRPLFCDVGPVAVQGSRESMLASPVRSLKSRKVLTLPMYLPGALHVYVKMR
jgi:hypothetical protein